MAVEVSEAVVSMEAEAVADSSLQFATNETDDLEN